jgi:hypothetical protein
VSSTIQPILEKYGTFSRGAISTIQPILEKYGTFSRGAISTIQPVLEKYGTFSRGVSSTIQRHCSLACRPDSQVNVLTMKMKRFYLLVHFNGFPT